MEQEEKNQIKVIQGEFSAELVIKRSRFIATIIGEADESQALEFIKNVRKKYYDATHNCYAFISDDYGLSSRFSDDGEPSGTAGMPMLEVLKRQDLKKSAVVVTRYFGGIKLGAGGLVSAYTKAVTNVIDIARIAIKKQTKTVKLECGFSDFSRLDALLKSDYLKILETSFADVVKIKVAVCSNNLQQFVSTINNITNGAAKTFINTTEPESYTSFLQ